MTSVNKLLRPRPAKEGFAYIDSTDPEQWDVNPISRIAPNDRDPYEVNGDGLISIAQPLTMELEQKFGIPENKRSKPGCTPVTNLLLPETSTMIYTDEFFQQPEAKYFLQNVQPNIYSYAVDTTPINSLANGISYTPQIPPKFRDQVYNREDGLVYPIYTRVDPQLIRDDGVPARLLEQPVRGDWSAKFSSFEAPKGSVNYEDIYDPRFNSYGADSRAYSNVELGNVSYYYSDVDAYRYPNYVIRSDVDFIEFTDPMGKIKPYYQRTAGINDSRPYVDNQFAQDTLYFRENLSESQSRPRLAQAWQQRFAPLSRASHSRSFKSGAM
jgi:hypothetical protein